MAVLSRSESWVRRRPLMRGPMLARAAPDQGSGGGGEIASMHQPRIDFEWGVGRVGLKGRSIRREDIEQGPGRIVGGGTDPRADFAGPPPIRDLPTPPHTCPAIRLQQLAPVGVGVEHIPRPMTSCTRHDAGGTPRDHSLRCDVGVEGRCRLQQAGALPHADRGNGRQVAVEHNVGSLQGMTRGG
jgi:hypothetical protein